MKRVRIEVNHVARRVVAELEISLLRRLEHHMIEVILGAEEWSRHVVPAVERQHLEVGVLTHCRCEIYRGVRSIEREANAGSLVIEIPFETRVLASTRSIRHVGLVV